MPEPSTTKIVSRYITSDTQGGEITGYLIATPYDADILALIKAIPGAKYIPGPKLWGVPITSKADLVAALPAIDKIATNLTDGRYRSLHSPVAQLWEIEAFSVLRHHAWTKGPYIRRHIPQIGKESTCLIPSEPPESAAVMLLVPGRHALGDGITVQIEVAQEVLRIEVVSEPIGTVYAARTAGPDADAAWIECGGVGETPEVPWTAVRYDPRACACSFPARAVGVSKMLERLLGWTFISSAEMAP